MDSIPDILSQGVAVIHAGGPTCLQVGFQVFSFKEGESINSQITRHLAIHLTGTVQGVGFRPFIYNLARQHDLVGTVLNNSRGVIVRVQGKEDQLRSFIPSIRKMAPVSAFVETVSVSSLPIADYTDFRILPSERFKDAFTQIPPDLALCSECRCELSELENRRFVYPFINCIQCGPRFTIIRELPYDRPLTTMSAFAMCSDCRTEYENRTDRRFHTQPIACPECGPTLTFLKNIYSEDRSDDFSRSFGRSDDFSRSLDRSDDFSRSLDRSDDFSRSFMDGWRPQGDADSAIAMTLDALRDRRIVLLQGIGGFHLACDARDENLVRELRNRKHRDKKPFALMFPSMEKLSEWCRISQTERELLTSARAPIVLLEKQANCPVAQAVAPENRLLGAMLPYSPLHFLILQEFGHPLVMTSANPPDEPISYRVDDALSRMRDIADAALIHNREIHIFTDDSITRVVSGIPRLWRRSRGYVPEAVHVSPSFTKDTLAFGPQLKNTFCLGKVDFALLSQYIGDMDSERALEAHRVAMEHFLHLFDAHVELAACDLHPDYATTRLAEEWCSEHGVPLVRVQHHHAHLAACLAENGYTRPCIGLCLDGTGYGSDGTVWGGEVLVGDADGFERAGHLQQVVMPGGELTVKEPWRMALAWLHETHGDRISDLPLKFLSELWTVFGRKTIEKLLSPHLIENVFPRTSSLGRLFDAVAAILFFGTHRQYEGQAAMQLEQRMSPDPAIPYTFDIYPEFSESLPITPPLPSRVARLACKSGFKSSVGAIVLSPIPMFHELTTDVKSGISPEIISRRFHEGIVDGFVRVCEAVRETSGLSTVALTGGCFQNSFLHSQLEERLIKKDFRVLTHRLVPANDGGVALGQAVVANAQKG